MSWNRFRLEGFQMIEKNELINTLYSEFIKNYSTFWENAKNVCHKFIKSAISLLKFFDFKRIFVGRCKCWDVYQKKRFFILIQKIWCFSLRRSEEILFDTKMPLSNSGISVAKVFVQRGRLLFFRQNHEIQNVKRNLSRFSFLQKSIKAQFGYKI